MKVAYLLSSFFRYDKLISPDAGPAIAKEYGWPVVWNKEEISSSSDVVIVDNRHHYVPELEGLLAFIQQNKRIKFLLRVNDPYFFHSNDPWYQMCASVLQFPNTHFLTPYLPTGILSQWLSDARYSNFVYAPFLYDESQELNHGHVSRIPRLAVSGNQRRELYPLRFGIQLVSKFRFSRTLFRTERLNHPGYPEKVKPSHSIMGSDYLSWLSGYRAAFTDSSIFRLEFLKYREIAYAGCAPVGDLPWSLFECPKEAFYQYRSFTDLLGLRQALHDHAFTQAVANAYRGFLRQHRSQSHWRQKVFQALANLV